MTAVEANGVILVAGIMPPSEFSLLISTRRTCDSVQFRGRLVRQYRACVVNSLGLGITCVFYHCTMCTRHPDLVSSAFYAIPIFHILI